MHYRVEHGILHLRLDREPSSDGDQFDGWYAVGFATDSGFNNVTLLAFVPKWFYGFNGYSLANPDTSGGVAVYRSDPFGVVYTGMLPDTNTLMEPLVDVFRAQNVITEVQIRLSEAGGSYPVTALFSTPLVFAKSWTNLAPDYNTCTGSTKAKYECLASLTPLTESASLSLLLSHDGSRTPQPPPAPPSPPPSPGMPPPPPQPPPRPLSPPCVPDPTCFDVQPPSTWAKNTCALTPVLHPTGSWSSR